VNAAVLQLQEHAADAIALAEQNLVADDERIGGIHAFQHSGPPWMVKLLLSSFWVKGHQPPTRQIHAQSLAVHFGNGWTGVAGKFITETVFFLACEFVECHETGAISLAGKEIVDPGGSILGTAADWHDYEIVVDQ